jgi:polysaccharide biosynthesis/export protein
MKSLLHFQIGLLVALSCLCLTGCANLARKRQSPPSHQGGALAVSPKLEVQSQPVAAMAKSSDSSGPMIEYASTAEAVEQGAISLAGYQINPSLPPIGIAQDVVLRADEPERSQLGVKDSGSKPVGLFPDGSTAADKGPSETDQAIAEGLARQLRWSGNYQIEPGDTLEIKFRSAKELNEIVTVRPDGMISLQIVGDQPAAGRTPTQVQDLLQAAYANDIVAPDLSVIVRSFSGNNIYVGGEVNSPVRIPLTGRITTLKAVILAGGFKDTADKRRVVVRRENGSCCQYDLKSVIECRSSNQDIELRPYDIVYVPKSRIAKVNLFVEQYIDKVLPFSRSFGVFVSHNTGIPGAVSSP